MRFASRTDAYLARSSGVLAFFALLLMVAAVTSERYGLAAFNLLLVLINGWVLASVASRRHYR